MSLLYECARGHRWTATAPSREKGVAAPVLCPECQSVGAATNALVVEAGRDTCALPPSASGTHPGDDDSAVTLAYAQPPPAGPGALPAIPGYEVLGELGRGGMGVVYKARQLNLNRLVAIKMVLAGRHAAPTDLVRLLAEAEAAAQLQHPHIVQVHEIGSHARLPFLSLEYADGGSLAQRLNGTPLQPREAATLAETLARAVQYAHTRGVVHRDLKPANVLLSGGMETPLGNCVPKIADFGLAKRSTVGSGMTQTGVILGTPSYIAPEQAEGKKDVGPPADVYALGAVLYEMLTGRPPFQGPRPMDTIMQVLREEPAPPRRLQPTVPRDLETVCLKCLRKDPRRRYASAEALADDLRRFLDNRAIAARPVGRLERARRRGRRNPAVAGLVAALAVVAVAAARLPLQERVQTLNNLNRASRRKGTSPGSCASRRRRNRRRRISYGSLPGPGACGPLQPAGGPALPRPGGARGAAAIRPSPELRDEVIACLALADLRPALPGEGREAGDPSAVENGPVQLAAVGDSAGNVRVYRRSDGRDLARLPGLRGPVIWHVTRFSPDGRFLAVYHPDNAADGVHVVVWDWRQGKALVEAPDEMYGGAFNWDAAGRRLAVGRPDKTVVFFDVLQGKSVHRLACGCTPDQLAFDPSGKRLAVTSAFQNNVQVFDLESDKRIVAWDHPAGVRGVAWSGDGRRLATGCDTGEGFVWDMDELRQQAVLRGHQKPLIRLAFSPRGDVLASDGWDGRIWLWDPQDGRPLVTTRGTLAGPFAADGRWLPTTTGLLEVASGAECRILVARETNSMGRPCFSRDGRLFTLSSNDGVHLWDAREMKEIRILPTGYGTAFFHPADDALVTYGQNGLVRRPVRTTADGGGIRVEVGRPRELKPYSNSEPHLMVAGSRDGRLLVSDFDLDHGGALLFLPERPDTPVRLPDPGATAVALSPDGRWAATGGWYGYTLKIWDASNGRLLRSIHVDHAAPRFSPDSRRLVACTNTAVRTWDTTTWAEGLSLPRDQNADLDLNGFLSSPEFSPDGSLLAVAYSSHQIRLVRADDLKPIAVLESPDPRLAGEMSFSPDGGLLAVGTDNGAQVWDLRAVRRAWPRWAWTGTCRRTRPPPPPNR